MPCVRNAKHSKGWDGGTETSEVRDEGYRRVRRRFLSLAACGVPARLYQTLCMRQK